MHAIEVLMEEHSRILERAQALEDMCVQLMEHNAFDGAQFADTIRFIREFADATHHMKEEDILFRVMLEQLGKPAENLIRHGMLVEHDEGRHYVTELEKACHAYTQDASVHHKLEVISWAMAYVHMIRSHAQKENDVVYPFAERMLSEEAKQCIDAEFESYIVHEPSRS